MTIAVQNAQDRLAALLGSDVPADPLQALQAARRAQLKARKAANRLQASRLATLRQVAFSDGGIASTQIVSPSGELPYGNRNRSYGNLRHLEHEGLIRVARLDHNTGGGPARVFEVTEKGETLIEETTEAQALYEELDEHIGNLLDKLLASGTPVTELVKWYPTEVSDIAHPSMVWEAIARWRANNPHRALTTPMPNLPLEESVKAIQRFYRQYGRLPTRAEWYDDVWVGRKLSYMRDQKRRGHLHADIDRAMTEAFGDWCPKVSSTGWAG